MDDIFEFVKAEETAYALNITVPGTDWEWNMKDHIRRTVMYKNSQFAEGPNDFSRPFNGGILLPILNLQYRTEGFDVKDILLYADDEKNYFKSFLIKKFHDRWAEEKGMDEFIDDTIESVVDFGGALVRDEDRDVPVNVPLTNIAFCDQTNMLGGPLGLKFNYSPDELQKYESRGWGDPKNGANVTIQEAIVLAKSSKTNDATVGKEDKTPGKYVEIYEIDGMMPETWYKNGGNPEKYVRQMQILMFYYDEQEKKKKGLKLFAGRQREGVFKVIKRDKIVGRALGRGGVEELFHPIVWGNYSEIAQKEMLDAATKVIIKTTDTGLKTRHPKGLKNLETLSIIEVEEGKDAAQMNLTPTNLPLFERAYSKWQESARSIAGANDSILGESPASGTPFKLQNLITMESHGLHDYRRGKNASAIAEVYRDWVLKNLNKELIQGKKFLEELSLKELQKIADQIVECQIEDVKKERVLTGQPIIPEEVERVKAAIRSNFMKKGKSHFLEIFKEEMKDVPTAVRVNIVGKQKNLDKVTDKIVNVIRQVIAAPQILQMPGMADLFNEIIEYSGLSPIDFDFTGMPQQVIPNAEPVPA